jgi:hypothetical protein
MPAHTERKKPLEVRGKRVRETYGAGKMQSLSFARDVVEKYFIKGGIAISMPCTADRVEIDFFDSLPGWIILPLMGNLRERSLCIGFPTDRSSNHG